MTLPLDRRPVVVVLAGPNGAGKTTFFRAHIQPAGLRFVNADVLTQELHLEPYAAARLADALEQELVEQRESFVFETVERVELLSVPSYIALRRNEVKDKVSVAAVEQWAKGLKNPEPIWADGDRDLLGSDEKGRT